MLFHLAQFCIFKNNYINTTDNQLAWPTCHAKFNPIIQNQIPLCISQLQLCPFPLGNHGALVNCFP